MNRMSETSNCCHYFLSTLLLNVHIGNGVGKTEIEIAETIILEVETAKKINNRIPRTPCHYWYHLPINMFTERYKSPDIDQIPVELIEDGANTLLT